MKLVDMKLPKAEPDKAVEASSVGGESPRYPYGLCLRLDADALAKLGLGKALPEVGAVMTISARAVVASVSQHESQDGGANQNVELQITGLAVGAEGADKPNPADKLYGKSKA